MATISHIRVARLNPAIARECESSHEAPGEGHPYGAPARVVVDPYTRRKNICLACHMAKALGTGECLC